MDTNWGCYLGSTIGIIPLIMKMQLKLSQQSLSNWEWVSKPGERVSLTSAHLFTIAIGCFFFSMNWKIKTPVPFGTSFSALVKTHLSSLLKSRRIYCRQRNAVRWVNIGDENTSFFQDMATHSYINKNFNTGLVVSLRGHPDYWAWTKSKSLVESLQK